MVHLWVEDFLELFTTVMVAYIFVMLGVVRRRIAIQLIFLDVILYSVGGVIGTMHHLYFSGTPVEHMALGAFFSAMEVIPLTFLTVEAWTFLQLGSRQQSRSSAPFPHRWAVMFLVAVGFWNFVGAGIFGFLINLPIVSYYQIGTALTANHAHGAMMGVYGMLAVGLALFALRYIIPPQRWPEKLAKLSFWSLNIGLAWMVFATLLPLGVLQLWHSVNDGYYEARTLGYITQPGNVVLEWLRMPGDFLFILGGVLPFVWIAWLGVRYGIKATTHRAACRDAVRRGARRGGRGPDRAWRSWTGAGAVALRVRPPLGRRDDGGGTATGSVTAGIGIAAWLTIGYARAARRCSHTASTRSPGALRSQGGAHPAGAFVYHEDHDAWLCPQDQWLWPKSFDPDNSVMRYRGNPSICNACPVKQTCTTPRTTAAR